MRTMRAVRAIAIGDFGATPTLHELPIPEPGAGEVLIHIQSSSVNGFDLAVTGGMIKGLMEHQFPLVLGRDFAGTVVTTGLETSRFAVGDAVFGVVFKPVLQDGAFADFVTMPEVFGVSPIPTGLDMTRAGVLGLAGTAARMAVDAVAPTAGERVLISGATGGVGELLRAAVCRCYHGPGRRVRMALAHIPAEAPRRTDGDESRVALGPYRRRKY
jgi:NADPH:quinone reductase-like Zn-dependent oxidoreductase